MLPFSNLKGLLRYLRVNLLGRKVAVAGACLSCGACCRNLQICHQGDWLRSARRFEKLKQEDPSYERFEIARRRKDGYLEFRCTWLDENNRCLDYGHRMDFCAGFPSPRLYYQDASLPGSCGFFFREVKDFRRVLDAQSAKGGNSGRRGG